MKPALYLLVCITLFSCQEHPPAGADLIVINADIWTGVPDAPSATAFAVQGDTLVAVGNDAYVMEWKGTATQVVDAGGHFVTPGIIDCHTHFITGGMNLASVQLRDAATPEEFIRRIGAFASTLEPGQWISGGEWDHERWGGELPTRQWIDSVTPQNPVFVRRLDGHMGLANSLALQQAGATHFPKVVEGGEIIRDGSGNPTGVLKDNAMTLVLKHLPPPSADTYRKALDAAMEYVASHGVTSVHHVAGTNQEGYLEAYEDAHAGGRLKTRVYVLTPLSEWQWLQARLQAKGPGDDWLKFGGLKGFVDGSLGAHTAAFLEPYTDAPQDRGFFLNNRDSLRQWIGDADQAGLQVAVHAIGDAAIRFLLDTYDSVARANGPRDRRFRIEHAQHISEADIPRFGALRVIPSMQPYHVADDGRWATGVIGPERSRTSYAFRSLIENRSRLAFGSDWFVAPPIPMAGIHAAVTRQTLDGKHPEGWVPDQKITIQQALAAYTVNAAYASFDETRKGTLEPGKLADFVLWDANPMEVPADQIQQIRALQTYVGGKRVFTQED